MRTWNIFQQLAGTWTFERQIINYANSKFSGVVTGTGTFVLVGTNQYLLNEVGFFKTVTVDKPFPVSKQFLFSFDSISKSICVDGATNNISTGRLFELSFEDSNAPCSTHLCINDNYEAQFSAPETDAVDVFGIKYTVHGPQKDYVSDTVFKRKLKA